MNGKHLFTKIEAEAIKSLIIQVRHSDKEIQKSIRKELREARFFYISDFTNSRKGFTKEDFEILVLTKKIIIGL